MQDRLDRRMFVAGAAVLAALGAVAPRMFATASEGAEEKAGETRVVTDMQGYELEIPADPRNIAITSWKGALEAFVIMGQLDRVKVLCDYSTWPWLTHAFPQIKDLPNYGSFANVSIEDLVQANLDLIISPEGAGEANEKMRELGLPVFVDGVTPEGAEDVFEIEDAQFLAYAEMLGCEDKADTFYQWTNEVMDMVAERVADIPEEERRRVLVTRSGIEEVFCPNISIGHCVTCAGGDLVTKDINEYFTTVDTEQIVAWDPEIMFQQQVAIDMDAVSEIYEGWASDERYQNITAVRNGDVYVVPNGIARWSGIPERALGTLYYAKLIYPDLFADVDVVEYARDFYKTFLDYELDDEGIAILFQDMKGAKPAELGMRDAE